MGTGIIRSTISKTWTGIKSLFGISSNEISRGIGESDSFEIEKSNARKIEKMNEDLLEYSKKYFQKSNELEQNVFDKIDDTVESILHSIKEVENVIIDGKKIKINLTSLKQEMNRLKRNKRGNFMNAIYKALSLDNKECLNILKMESGIEKEKNMKSFLSKILNNELKALGILAKEILEENLSMIKEILEEKLIGIEESIKEEIENFRRLEESRESSIKDRDLLLKNKIREKIMYIGIVHEKI